METGKIMHCPHCESQKTVKNGRRKLKSSGQEIQYDHCHHCGRKFNERTGTVMAGLRTSPSVVEYAIHSRTEGMGLRATARVYGKAHGTIIGWEKKSAAQTEHWSPPAPAESDITLEGDELYTRVGENLSPLRE